MTIHYLLCNDCEEYIEIWIDRDCSATEYLRERLADFAHSQWSNWMIYMLQKCNYDKESGDVIIPADYAKALERQMWADYDELSDEEKDLDRAEADSILEVLNE